VTPKLWMFIVVLAAIVAFLAAQHWRSNRPETSATEASHMARPIQSGSQLEEGWIGVDLPGLRSVEGTDGLFPLQSLSPLDTSALD
jgi:hypothetical protein